MTPGRQTFKLFVCVVLLSFCVGAYSSDNSCTRLGGECLPAESQCNSTIPLTSWACGWNFMKWKCCRKEVEGTTFTKPDEECGLSANPANEGWRIVNGEQAKKGSWPWQVSLKLRWNHFCGGTIIDKYWVLTAAHCFRGIQPRYTQVVVGEHAQHLKDGYEKIHYVEQAYIHSRYNPTISSAPHDIALLKLRNPIQFNQRVRKACLPNHPNPAYFEGTQCWLTGWGDSKGTADQRYLQQVLVPVLKQDSCRMKWGWNTIHPGMLCVGTATKSACMGDSGGPMVCRRGQRFYLEGTTSWGTQHCAGMPGVYTRVSWYLGWIDRIIRSYRNTYG